MKTYGHELTGGRISCPRLAARLWQRRVSRSTRGSEVCEQVVLGGSEKAARILRGCPAGGTTTSTYRGFVGGEHETNSGHEHQACRTAHSQNT